MLISGVFLYILCAQSILCGKLVWARRTSLDAIEISADSSMMHIQSSHAVEGHDFEISDFQHKPEHLMLISDHKRSTGKENPEEKMHTNVAVAMPLAIAPLIVGVIAILFKVFFCARMRASSQEGDAIEYGERKTNPTPPMLEHVNSSITVPRIVVVTVGMSVAVLGYFYVKPEEFATQTSLRNVMDLKDCQNRCSLLGKTCLNDTVTFEVQMCTLKGNCISKEEAANKGDERSMYASTPSCKFMVVPGHWWHPYAVFFILILAIIMTMEGVAAEVALISTSCIFTILGVIDTNHAFGGFSSGAVVGLAFLFPIAAAIEETGILEKAVIFLLGNPTSFYVAIVKMMLVVAVLSAFLSNTAIVMMMIPIVISWSRRLGVSPGKMLMPLSFSAQLGGTLTLIGSSHCLVAKEAIDPQVYDMGFFDLAPVGVISMLGSFCAICIALPLLSSSAMPLDEAEKEEATVEDEGEGKDQFAQVYSITLLVVKNEGFVDALSSEVQSTLSRFPGVISVTMPSAEHLLEDAEVQCRCTARGLVEMRKLRELHLKDDVALLKMGSHRRKRRLFEVAVSPKSDFVGKCLNAHEMMTKHGFCPIAVRGKCSVTGSVEDVKVKAGDVIIVEADVHFTTTEEWENTFDLTRMVPNSIPPRVGGERDERRGILVILGMGILIGLVTFDIVKLSNGGGLLVLLYIIIRARSLEQVYQSIKPSVLLTVAGAFGVSEALQKVGVAQYLGTKLLTFTAPMGDQGVRAGIYAFSALLGCGMNNSATVAILGPMISNMAVDSGMNAVSLVFILINGAGACFISPLGYQTNLMVMKDGGYTFGDFVKFGLPVQLMHMVIVLISVILVCDVAKLF